MLDIGWMELLVIGIVALVVVGPKELPGMFRAAGQFMGKARSMAREFQRSMEQAANESGLSESAKQLNALNAKLNTRVNLNSATTSARRYADNLIKEDTGKPPAAGPVPEADAAASTPSAPAPAEQAAAEPAKDATGSAT